MACGRKICRKKEIKSGVGENVPKVNVKRDESALLVGHGGKRRQVGGIKTNKPQSQTEKILFLYDLIVVFSRHKETHTYLFTAL